MTGGGGDAVVAADADGEDRGGGDGVRGCYLGERGERNEGGVAVGVCERGGSGRGAGRVSVGLGLIGIIVNHFFVVVILLFVISDDGGRRTNWR